MITIKARLYLNEVLGHSSIVRLRDHDGNGTGLFTTCGARAEEQKTLRLTDYVANVNNFVAAVGNKSNLGNNETQRLINNSSSNLTDKQTESIKYFLQNDNGIRILQGLTRTGKSHMFGKIHNISESMRAMS